MGDASDFKEETVPFSTTFSLLSKQQEDYSEIKAFPKKELYSW